MRCCAPRGRSAPARPAIDAEASVSDHGLIPPVLALVAQLAGAADATSVGLAWGCVALRV